MSIDRLSPTALFIRDTSFPEYKPMNEDRQLSVTWQMWQGTLFLDFLPQLDGLNRQQKITTALSSTRKIMGAKFQDLPISNLEERYVAQKVHEAFSFNLDASIQVAAGLQAREQLINSLSHYPVWMASRYLDYGTPKEDIVQEGNIAVIKAVDWYNPHKEYKLSTFVHKIMRRHLHAFVFNDRLGSEHTERFRRQIGIINYVSSLLLQELEIIPDAREIAEIIDSQNDLKKHFCKEDKRVTPHMILTKQMQYDMRIMEDIDSPHGDVPYEADDRLDNRHLINTALAVINFSNERRQFILNHSWGLNNTAQLTDEEIASALKTKVHTVTQYRWQELTKIRKWLYATHSDYRRIVNRRQKQPDSPSS